LKLWSERVTSRLETQNKKRMSDDGDASILVKFVECFRGLFRLVRYASVLNKYWGYNCSTFMYFVVLVFICVGFGLPLFRDHYAGTHYFVDNCTIAQGPYNTTWSVTEFYFELVVNLGGSDIHCKYSDGQCDLGEIGPCLPNLYNKWDLKPYGAAYGASFAFALIAVFLSIAMMPLLQFLQWKPMAVQRKMRITLFGITLGVAIAVFVCILVAYSIQIGHPRQVVEATGYSANYCDQYSVSGHFAAGTLCSWLGHRSVSSVLNEPAYLPFTGLRVKGFYEYWNPRVGWQLLQVSLGISLWNIIVIVGWRPNMSGQ